MYSFEKTSEIILLIDFHHFQSVKRLSSIPHIIHICIMIERNKVCIVLDLDIEELVVHSNQKH